MRIPFFNANLQECRRLVLRSDAPQGVNVTMMVFSVNVIVHEGNVSPVVITSKHENLRTGSVLVISKCTLTDSNVFKLGVGRTVGVGMLAHAL